MNKNDNKNFQENLIQITIGYQSDLKADTPLKKSIAEEDELNNIHVNSESKRNIEGIKDKDL